MEKTIVEAIRKILQELSLGEEEIVNLTRPEISLHGDFSTNVAMSLWRGAQGKLEIPTTELKSPLNLAQLIASKLTSDENLSVICNEVKAVAPGFVNFYLKNDAWENEVKTRVRSATEVGINDEFKDKKIMVEYGHPNTHKELHIGHMRTLVTGEALARVFTHCQGQVFRANYQGDIGPHVAKALWGAQQLLNEMNQTLEEIGAKTKMEKAKFLGDAYVRGSADYENHKNEIDELNKQLYLRDPKIWSIYETTRSWSIEYFEDFYQLFDTKFDRCYFETEIAEKGMKIVLENTPKIFQVNEEAHIFKGEDYGLHTRVFITRQGTPTYEAKDLGLAFKQFDDFPFDKNIHVVANEQEEYFKVVFKALGLIDDKFVTREFHLSMGMVQLVGQKMSSRTGVIVKVDELIEQVKNAVKEQLGMDKSEEQNEKIETLALGAIKYAILKQSTRSNVTFDIKNSVSLLGNTGPYLQYTYARSRSILKKSGLENWTWDMAGAVEQEITLIKQITIFEDAVRKSAQDYSLHHLTEYLFVLAAKFNTLYNDLLILQAEKDEEKFRRLELTKLTSEILKQGLTLLGIKAPESL